MNPLTQNPTEAQSRLLEIVYKGRELAGGPCFHPVEVSHVPHRVGRAVDAWPIFQYVEAIMHREHRVDARAVIAETPSIRFETGFGRYGWVQLERPNAGPQPEDKVRLTISGMAHVAEASTEVAAFIETLALLVERERQFAPHPAEIQVVEIWSGEIRKRLEQRWVIGDDDNLTALVELLRHEPSTWHCQVTPTQHGPWSVRPSPFVRDYAGVTSAVEYVDRLVETIGHTDGRPSPLHASSLSLPEAIDYLNAVWRLSLSSDEALIRMSRADAAAKLALDCVTVDEFESRLSAFVGILGQIRLPGISGNKKLVDLRAYLGDALDGDAAARAQDAVDDLRAVVDLRNWRQHPGTDGRAFRAADRLGIALPSDDWGATWDQIRARSVAALSAIREEIERLPLSDPSVSPSG